MRPKRAVFLAVLLSGFAWGQKPPAEATRLNNEAVRLASAGKYGQAERTYRAALDVQSLDDLTRAKIAGNLARLYQSEDRYADAEELFRRALEWGRKALPPGSPEVAHARNDLGQLYWNEGRYWDARNLVEAAVEALENSDPQDPELALMWNNLAVIHKEYHEYDQAEKLLRKALSSCEELRGPKSREFATALNNLAMVLDARQDFEGAGALYWKAIGIFKALGPSATAELAGTLGNLGRMYHEQNHYEEAEQTEQRALALLEPGVRSNAVLRATILHSLGSIVAAQGSAEASLPYFEQSLAIREKTLGLEHPALISVLLDYAKVTLRTGQKSLARRLRKRAEQLLARRRPDPSSLRVPVSALQQDH